MIHSIARLCSALCLAICCSFSNAQTLNADGTTSTDNLITSQPGYNQEGTWSGIGGYSQLNGAQPGDLWGCCTSYSGAAPFLDTSTTNGNGDSGQIHWSYGQSTVSQIIGVNTALANAGVGIQVNGYNWGYELRNMNGSGGQNGTDTLTSYSFLKDSAGNVIASRSLTHNVQHEWQSFSGTESLNNPYDLSDVGQLGIEFSSRDAGYWAGYYGPQIKNVSLSLRYTAGAVDPCDTDPLYSTSCAGYAEAYKNLQCQSNPLYDQTCPGYAQAYYDQQCSLNPLYDNACPGRSEVVTSGNLVRDPGGSSGWFGGSINNSFAINQALSHSGSGVMIHGFNWGYRAINFNPFGIGLGSSTVNVNIRDGDGTSLHAWSRNNTSYGENWYSSSYVFPQSRNNTTLGNFEFTATSSGWGYVDSMWARAIFTPDSCSLDPLSSVLCTGYEKAFLEQQCSMNTLYSPQCPGYADALAEMLAEQALLASATTTTDTNVNIDTNTGVNTGTTASAATGTQDPTKTDATVTTDVGGVELSTTGEIVVADSVPSTVKEAAKESTKTPEEKSSGETKTATTTEKKTTKVNAVALAMAAVRETEATARATAEAAVAQSQSAAANPEDGTGATINIGGITLAQLRAATTAGQDSSTVESVNRASQQAVASSRALSAEAEDTSSNDDRSSTISTTGDVLHDTVKQTTSANYSLIAQDDVEEKIQDRKSAGSGLSMPNMSILPTIPEEPKAATGPSVRRGGAVDGMSGGDMNALASIPANFNDYLGKQMQDAQFYASKDIYRNQRNVDNARALRGLGTDRLHQQMVEQQYNITGR